MMMNSNHDDGNHSDSSDSFSPIQRRSLPLHASIKNPNNDSTLSRDDQQVADDSLPALPDKSWIGARVSPIQSFDNDHDDDEDEQDGFDDIKATEPYRKALNESLEASFLVATERSTLLGGNMRRGRGGGFTMIDGTRRGGTGFVGDGNFSSLHPLWDDKDAVRALKQKGKINADHWWFSGGGVSYWGIVVTATSGILLTCMGLHDAYLKYLSYRRGVELSYSLTWTVPWMVPSGRTLVRFGAFCPSRLIELKEYWRVLSSMVVSTSVAEWIILSLAWATLRRGNRSFSNRGILPTSSAPTASTMGFGRCLSASLFVWPLLYIASVLTGQLWVIAFHSNNAISGCASWGTCGILCAVGVSQPNRRFLLFMIAISLVLLDLIQPFTSAYGAIGGSFFGWSFYGVGYSSACPVMNPHKVHGEMGNKTGIMDIIEGWLKFLSAVVMLALWIIPIFFIVREGVL